MREDYLEADQEQEVMENMHELQTSQMPGGDRDCGVLDKEAVMFGMVGISSSV